MRLKSSARCIKLRDMTETACRGNTNAITRKTRARSGILKKWAMSGANSQINPIIAQPNKSEIVKPVRTCDSLRFWRCTRTGPIPAIWKISVNPTITIAAATSPKSAGVSSRASNAVIRTFRTDCALELEKSQNMPFRACRVKPFTGRDSALTSSGSSSGNDMAFLASQAGLNTWYQVFAGVLPASIITASPRKIKNARRKTTNTCMLMRGPPAAETGSLTTGG